MGGLSLSRHEPLDTAFQTPRLFVEPLDCAKRFFQDQLGVIGGAFQHANRLVINLDGMRNGCLSLPPSARAYRSAPS